MYLKTIGAQAQSADVAPRKKRPSLVVALQGCRDRQTSWPLVRARLASRAPQGTLT